MKFAVLVLIFVDICNSFERLRPGAAWKAIHEKCLAANGGDRVVIDELIHMKLSSNENGKCYRACILQECKYFDDDGKFKDNVPKRIGRILHGGVESNIKPVEEAAAKCVSLQTYDDSDCNIAEDFARCLVEQSDVTLTLNGIFDW